MSYGFNMGFSQVATNIAKRVQQLCAQIVLTLAHIGQIDQFKLLAGNIE